MNYVNMGFIVSTTDNDPLVAAKRINECFLEFSDRKKWLIENIIP